MGLKRQFRLFLADNFLAITTVLAVLLLVGSLARGQALSTEMAAVAVAAVSMGSSVLAWQEARRARVNQQRPFVLVGIDNGPLLGINGLVVAGDARLTISNRGQGAAIDVHVAFDGPLRDSNGEEIAVNPITRDGIRFLAPSQTLSIKLENHAVLDRLLDAQRSYREGETPPPQQAPRLSVRLRYRDLATNHLFRDEYDLALAEHVFGWESSNS